MDGLLLLILALTFLFTLIGFFSFNTLVRWHEAHLQILQGLGHRSIWLIFFASFLFGFLSLALRIHTLRLPPVWHKSLLALVSAYTFVFFNPFANMSSAKEPESVYCPDGYAYQIESKDYIRCEDFDLYYGEKARTGNVRTDLFLNQKSGVGQ